MGLTVLLLVLLTSVPFAASAEQERWAQLFDGETLEGWKASAHPESFSVRDGMIVARGQPFSHLFYVGEVNGAFFQNFELKVDVMTSNHSNGGIYFHTAFQDTGWPARGFEVQVNNTYKDPRKTGSLYRVQDVMTAPAKDHEWFTEHIIVSGDRIVVKVDGKTVVDWIQPEDWTGVHDGTALGQDFYPDRRIIGGTIALQAHDPESTVYYKNIRVKVSDK